LDRHALDCSDTTAPATASLGLRDPRRNKGAIRMAELTTTDTVGLPVFG
jgi:hypothetical protein